jgi:hypothetical protein
VLLDRDRTNETVVVEIVDLFADIGEDRRGLERKVGAVRRQRPDRRCDQPETERRENPLRPSLHVIAQLG